MNNFNIDNFINSQKNSNNINLNDFPELDLYMDQVMQVFEKRLAYTKRYETDKVLTKTMINNYAKDNLLINIKNKKYSKNHLILMGLIYNLKGSLSLTDIKTLLTPMVNDLNSGEDYPLYDVYQSFLDIYDSNLEELKNLSTTIQENTLNTIKSKNSSLGKYEENFLLVCAFVEMSNLFRRISEKIIDECFENPKEKK